MDLARPTAVGMGSEASSGRLRIAPHHTFDFRKRRACAASPDGSAI